MPLWPLQAQDPHLSPAVIDPPCIHVHVFCHASLSAQLLNVLLVKDVIIGLECHQCPFMLNVASCLSHVCLKCKFYVWSLVYKQLDNCRLDKVCWKWNACCWFQSLCGPPLFTVSPSLPLVNWVSFCVWEWKRREQERDTQIEILMASVRRRLWVVNTQQPKSFINKVAQ